MGSLLFILNSMRDAHEMYLNCNGDRGVPLRAPSTASSSGIHFRLFIVVASRTTRPPTAAFDRPGRNNNCSAIVIIWYFFDISEIASELRRGTCATERNSNLHALIKVKSCRHSDVISNMLFHATAACPDGDCNGIQSTRDTINGYFISAYKH